MTIVKCSVASPEINVLKKEIKYYGTNILHGRATTTIVIKKAIQKIMQASKN